MNNLFEILRAFWPLLVLYAALLVWALLDLVKRKQTRHLPKWAWVLIILFISTIGPISYLVLGRDWDDTGAGSQQKNR